MMPRAGAGAGAGATPSPPLAPSSAAGEEEPNARAPVAASVSPRPANAFANDGNFMAQFLASTESRASKPPVDVVDAAAEDDSVRASVRKNDGSFMASFLALQSQQQSQKQPAQSVEPKPPRVELRQPPRPKPLAKRAVSSPSTASQPRKRSRWDVGPAPPAPAEPEAEAKPADLASPQQQERIRAKQRKHQQELRFLEQRIRGFQQQVQLADSDVLSASEKTAQLSEERRQEYARLAALAEQQRDYKDSLEDAELGLVRDGTVEHRKRAQEMLHTLETAATLTQHGEGKHHLGDFLPQGQLDRFLREATRRGNSGKRPALPASSTAGPNLASASDVQRRDGLVVPSTGGASAGLGAQASSELQEDDDEFDQYRKRMMLAYRFRPNPLNNPRRPYN